MSVILPLSHVDVSVLYWPVGGPVPEVDIFEGVGLFIEGFGTPLAARAFVSTWTAADWVLSFFSAE